MASIESYYRVSNNLPNNLNNSNNGPLPTTSGTEVDIKFNNILIENLSFFNSYFRAKIMEAIVRKLKL